MGRNGCIENEQLDDRVRFTRPMAILAISRMNAAAGSRSCQASEPKLQRNRYLKKACPADRRLSCSDSST